MRLLAGFAEGEVNLHDSNGADCAGFYDDFMAPLRSDLLLQHESPANVTLMDRSIDHMNARDPSLTAMTCLGSMDSPQSDSRNLQFCESLWEATTLLGLAMKRCPP